VAPTEEPASGEPSPEPEPTTSSRPPEPASASSDGDDAAVYEDVAGGGSNPQQDSGTSLPSTRLFTATEIDAACASLGLSDGCTANLAPARVVETALALASRCLAESDNVCATAREAANSAVALAVACVNALLTPEGSAQAGVVDVDCDQTADNALVLAGYLVQVANDCAAGATSVCQAAYDLSALALDRAAGCLTGALDATVAIRVIDLDGTDVGCAEAVSALWRTAQGTVAYLTGCLMGQDDMCNEVRGIAEFGLAAMTNCVGEAFLRLTDVPNPLPAKDAPFECWQAIDQVNHALNDVLGRLPNVPTEISVAEDCVVTTRPRVIDNPDDQQDVAQELLVPSCYPPEVAPPVSPGIVLLAADGGALPSTGGDGPECNYTRDFKVTNVFHDWKKRLDEDEFTNINASKVKYTLELTKSDTFKASVGGAAEAEAKFIVGKVKAQMNWSIAYEWKWDAKRSITVEIPARTTYHYAFAVTSKVSEGNWVERLDDCSYKTGAYHRVKAPYKEGRYVWQEPYEGGPPS
jgi:hypothetical protein